MIIKASNLGSSRRQFLKNMLPVGTLLCFGCNNLFALSQVNEQSEVKAAKHKFMEDSGMSYKQVHELAFRRLLIPILQNLANSTGKDELIEMLMKASSEASVLRGENWAKRVPESDLSTFTANFKKPSRFFEHTCTYQILEYTEKVVELKYTECICATIFREENASDIGYSAICHGDFAIAQAFNPKIKLIRTKTLMQGNDCCNHRYIWEG